VVRRLPELTLAELPPAGDLLTVVAAAAVLDEDYALAVELVGRASEIADRTETPTWPCSPAARTRADLSPDRYEAAWRDGEQLTLSDIATADDTD
jgi:hypothetical protein